MSDFSSLYIPRKCGRGLGRDRKTAFLLPMLMILLISAVLVFALVFIQSVSGTIERMLAILGRGSVFVESQDMPDSSFLPEGAEVTPSRILEGLVYSGQGEGAAVIHAVGPGYFDGMRGRELGIVILDEDVLNPAVVSSSFADKLSVGIGDRMTLLLYEADKDRTRPLLLTVSGIFPSVYPQLDSSLVYIQLESSGYGADGFEVLLPESIDAESFEDELWRAGYSTRSYMDMYSSIYSNAVSSINALYLVFMAVALLAAYFASDAAYVYISRDRNDIEMLMMLGAPKALMRSVYLRITMAGACTAMAIGIALGLILGFLSPYAFSIIASFDPAILSYYVTSFSVSIPWSRIAFMIILMIVIAAISVEISLFRLIRRMG